MDAVYVAWTGAVCSFVRDACTHAVKNRLNRACAKGSAPFYQSRERKKVCDWSCWLCGRCHLFSCCHFFVHPSILANSVSWVLTDRALPAPCLRLLALLLTGNEEEIRLIVIIFPLTRFRDFATIKDNGRYKEGFIDETHR